MRGILGWAFHAEEKHEKRHLLFESEGVEERGCQWALEDSQRRGANKIPHDRAKRAVMWLLACDLPSSLGVTWPQNFCVCKIVQRLCLLEYEEWGSLLLKKNKTWRSSDLKRKCSLTKPSCSVSETVAKIWDTTGDQLKEVVVPLESGVRGEVSLYLSPGEEANVL